MTQSLDAVAQMDGLKDILRRYWGFDSYLPLQEEAMQCVLEAHDSVVVLPTGGGKSLCFQAPAMCRQGLTLVVSPLISLMKDQVDSLRSCGVPAACIHSMISFQEKRQITEEIRAGRLRLLYVAPERLVQERTVSFLQQINVSFVAIDEAHCISSWGHDFRPEYRELRMLKEALPGLGVHAYTATASEQVRQDIASQLGLESPRFLVGSFDRPNLVYKVQARSDLLKQLRTVLERHEGESGIIYCISRREVDRVSATLNQLGYQTRPYHAGMEDDERRENQDAFIEERIHTIVATVAFGMGIDKSNVRYVIHAGMPKSLEHYQQESGRAGRDGLEAECCLIYSPQDLMTWRKILGELEPTTFEGANRALSAMYDFCTSVLCRHRAIVEHFGQSYLAAECKACDVCLGDLDLVDDPLIVGQKILSCVLRLGQRYGGDYTAMVLAGSEDQRIVQMRHDRLSTWGLLAEERKRTIRDWIEQLVGQGYLSKTGDYSVLEMTPQGRSLLKGESAPRLLRPVRRTKQRPAVEEDSWEGVDRGLFDYLRTLRRERAEIENVPAYIVFGDAALRDMARKRPSNLDAFRRVKGVGDKKLHDYGEFFVERIVEYCRDHEVSLDTVPPPPEESAPRSAARMGFAFFQRGCSVDETAQKLQRARSTVIGYLCDYIREQRLTDGAPWVETPIFERVAAAVREVGQDGLRPIFDHLEGKVSYEEIRVVLACLQNQEAAQSP